MREQVLQYVGARYVPILFNDGQGGSEWQPNTYYEPLTIVTYNNASYTSRQPVSASIGNPVENEEYWTMTGNYNAYVQELQESINKINKKIFVTPEDYGAAGDGVADDTAAIQAALDSGNNVVGTLKYKITRTIHFSKSFQVCDLNEIEYAGPSNGSAVSVQWFNTVFRCNKLISSGNGIEFAYDKSMNENWAYAFNCEAYVNSIVAEKYCVYFNGDVNNGNNSVQYCKIGGNKFESKQSHAIYVHNSADGVWFNQNLFQDINIIAPKGYGIYLDNATTKPNINLDGNVFTNVSPEGAAKGWFFNNVTNSNVDGSRTTEIHGVHFHLENYSHNNFFHNMRTTTAAIENWTSKGACNEMDGAIITTGPTPEYRKILFGFSSSWDTLYLQPVEFWNPDAQIKFAVNDDLDGSEMDTTANYVRSRFPNVLIVKKNDVTITLPGAFSYLGINKIRIVSQVNNGFSVVIKGETIKIPCSCEITFDETGGYIIDYIKRGTSYGAPFGKASLAEMCADSNCWNKVFTYANGGWTDMPTGYSGSNGTLQLVVGSSKYSGCMVIFSSDTGHVFVRNYYDNAFNTEWKELTA